MLYICRSFNISRLRKKSRNDTEMFWLLESLESFCSLLNRQWKTLKLEWSGAKTCAWKFVRQTTIVLARRETISGSRCKGFIFIVPREIFLIKPWRCFRKSYTNMMKSFLINAQNCFHPRSVPTRHFSDFLHVSWRQKDINLC